MDNLRKTVESFATPTLIVLREIKSNKISATVAYHPDLVDTLLLTELIKAVEISGKSNITELLERTVVIAESKLIYSSQEVEEALLTGDAVIELKGNDSAMVLCNLRKWDKRAISEPPTATVMRGPREGFIEDLKTSLSLIERRLKTSTLAVEKMTLGRLSKTSLAVVYLDGVADNGVVAAVKKRLKKIELDGIIDSRRILAR